MATCALVCSLCQASLSIGRNRRLLKPPSPSSEDASRFLTAYVSPLLLESQERAYACKKCYAKLEKGHKTVDAIQAIVKDLRDSLSLPPVAVTVTTAFGENEVRTSSVRQTTPRGVRMEPDLQPPSAAVPRAKRARRSLSYPPDSESTRDISTTAQTPEVKVTIKRPGQDIRKYNVPKKYKQMVQSVRYRQSPYTARVILKSTPLKNAVVNQLATTIRRECASLCSRSSGDSVLRLLSVLELKDFSWKALLQELKKKAPTLLQLLKAASFSRTHTSPSIVGMAASVLLNGRNPQLCIPQALISVVLYAGHCAKKVYTRLHKLGVCVSHKKTTELIRQLGAYHEERVRKWRQLLENPVVEEVICEAIGDVAMDAEGGSEISETSLEISTTGSERSADSHESSEMTSNESSFVSESCSSSYPCTYTVVGDNLDKTVSPRYMRSDHQRQSIHYFHMYAALDRVSAVDLPADRTVGDIATTPLSAFLPSPADCKQLRKNYATLLGRTVVKRLLFFKVFEDCVVQHIQHKHSNVMKQKSAIVPLGILPKNENQMDEMVDILKTIQQKYVPVDIEGSQLVRFQQLAFAGDQLTAARARKSRTVRANSKSLADSLHGLVPFASDWHAKVNFMEIIWSRLYSTESSMDGGTLHQLRNLINRVNVGRQELKHQVNEVEDFLELVIECHLTSAAMHFFGMKSVHDAPSRNGFSDTLPHLSLCSRRKVFYDRMERIIDEFVVPQEFSSTRESTDPVTSSSTNPHVQRVQLEHSYSQFSSGSLRHRLLPPSLLAVRQPTASLPVRRAAPDGILNYGSAVLNDGLLLFQFKDAIREGDGERILQCWKVLLMYYRSANHTNYASEAFHFIAQVTATASPRVATQLLWSRVVNTKGKEGHNIPVDMHMEHLNRTVKEYIGAVGANVAQNTIIQCGQSLNGIMAVTKNYDRDNGVHSSSSQHTRKSDSKDFERIIQELNKTKVFDYVPGRAHTCKKFRNIEPNIATRINKDKLFQWLSEKKKEAVKSMKYNQLFGHNTL